MEAKAAFKGRDRLSEEQEPNRQQSRKQFSNPFLEMMTPKVDYDSRRYSSNHQAWSVSSLNNNKIHKKLIIKIFQIPQFPFQFILNPISV